MISESFLKDLASNCVDANINLRSVPEIRGEIEDFVELDTLAAYYISVPPLPEYPEIELDIFLLTKDFIYNYEVNKSGNSWAVIPLTSVPYFRESVWTDSNFWSLIISTSGVSDEDAVIILDKLEKKSEIHKFTIALRNNLAKVAL